MKNIAIIGSGSWGVALSIHLAKLGNKIKIWSFSEEEKDLINNEKKCKFLPNVKLPEGIECTTSYKEAIEGSELILHVTPSKFTRNIVKGYKQYVTNQPIVICSKGFEADTLLTLDEVILEEIPNAKIAVLSGPSHAEEVSIAIPTVLVVASKYDASHNNGLIKIELDDELMHGATITISYELTVTNVGETDYTGQDFYYKGTGASDSNEVTTTANVVLDYVANNLQYRVADDEDGNWSVVSDVISAEGLNGSLSDAVEQFNTIIKTETLSKDLKPGETTTTGLVLTQLMTAQNTVDDRTYNNIAEITTISNSVGRRMAFSIQGNQDPTAEEPAEVDSVKSEEVIVIPPTGIGEIVVYIAVSIAALAILVGGIIFIKKKVLKKVD